MHDMYVIHTCYVLRVHHAQVVYTIQHSMYNYYTYTRPHTHSTIHTTLYYVHTYIHLLNTYAIDDVYTHSIQYM